MSFILFVVFVALAAKFLYRLVDSSAKPSKTRRRREPNGYSFQAVEKRRKRFMAKEVPAALEKAGMFAPLFLQKAAVSYLETGNPPELSEGDLTAGADYSDAYNEFLRIQRVLSGRQSAMSMLEGARKSGAKSAVLKVTRKDVNCDRVPKERVYRLDEDIPIYPCDDCDVQPACLAWYSYVWD